MLKDAIAIESLDELVRVAVDYQRSVSIENAGSAARVVEGYIPTERALDMITRIASATEAGPRVRAWSVTGPYGSGKSSFLALASALLGDSRTSQFQSAQVQLGKSAPVLRAGIDSARVRAAIKDRGYILALAAASPEPATRVVARALLNGADTYWSGRGRKPSVLRELRELASSRAPSPSEVLRLFTELEVYAPVFLAIDEFGKILEYSADEPVAGDLYVMQLLAEHVNASRDTVSCVLTLQHLAMSDYSQSVSSAQRREWNKVQGRFQEVAFANSPDQAIAFVRGHLRRSSSSPKFDTAVSLWADGTRSHQSQADTPLLQSVCLDAESTYPLHPLVVATVPALSQRYSQGDRSLHTWLASSEPSSVAHFLADARFEQGANLPIYGMDKLFVNRPGYPGDPVV